VHSILFDSSVHLRRGGQLDCETQAAQTFRLHSTTNPFLKFQCLVLLLRIAIPSRCPDSAGFVVATIRRQNRRCNSQIRLTCIRIPDHSIERTSTFSVSLLKYIFWYLPRFPPFFLPKHPSINIHPQSANILWSFVHRHINTPSPHQTSLINKDILPIKHNPQQTSQQEQAIMSDASDSTFTAGETKLLISIIKNLTGDLQVCLLSLSASDFPAFPFASKDCVAFLSQMRFFSASLFTFFSSKFDVVHRRVAYSLFDGAHTYFFTPSSF
jgi:hypothetical protein